MNKISVQEVSYKNYGKCIEISNGIIELIVTIDVGPRIIRYSFCGGRNFMFNDLNRDVSQSGKAFDDLYGTGSAWYIYGGHRIWLSPEDYPHSYYPDNEPVEWKEIPGGFSFIPPAQKANDVQMQMDIFISEDSSDVKINNYVKNIGSETKNFAIWALTVLGPNGLEIVPQPDKDTGLLGNRVLALWPYSDMQDERVYWGKKYITLRQDPKATCAYKFGLNSQHGYAAYLNHGAMFVKKYQPNPIGTYPDFGVSYETYTNNYFIEAETLGELCDVTPGSTAAHSEHWYLVPDVTRPEPNDEAAIDELVAKYILK